ncbi:J domain-containing protein [Filimonas lacunae]|nr:J domain-containing protein [Filimonas lacunae]
MSTKDYYRILEIKPSAGSQEIRKAYRALAQRFHPDKNAGNPLAQLRFQEIKEAYEVLCDKQKRDAWHYQHYNPLQKSAPTAYSADDILQQSIQLYKKYSNQDPFRLNQDTLFAQIKQLLSNDYIRILQLQGEIHTNSAVINNILQSTYLLPYEYVQPISALLKNITPVLPQTEEDIQSCLLEKKRQMLWNKYKIPLAILLAGVLITIMLLSK